MIIRGVVNYLVHLLGGLLVGLLLVGLAPRVMRPMRGTAEPEPPPPAPISPMEGEEEAEGHPS
jgi:hypothetical protein